MSDKRFQHDPNDELLSAYLDDALAPDERAAVEARLANDPDAQQLLLQLRSVSQSVQRLPLEPVTRDLRAEVLRRVEVIKNTSSGTTSPSANATGPSADKPTPVGDGTLPKLSIFQTRRAWIWASLAVAAALMIMVLQPGSERNDLPAIAQRDSSSGVERRLDELKVAEKEIVAPSGGSDASKIARNEDLMERERTLDSAAGQVAATPPVAASPEGLPTESSSPAFEQEMGVVVGAPLAASSGPRPAVPAAGLPAPTPPAGDSTAMVGRSSASSPSASSESSLSIRAAAPQAPGSAEAELTTSDEPVLGGRLAKAPAAAPQTFGAQAGAAGVGGGAMKAPLAPRQPTEWNHQGSVVMVHIVAKPEAYANRSLDKLLESRGISVETPSQAATNRLSDLAKDKVAESSDGSAHEDVDVLLVEAPESSIVSCLTDLQRDSANFAGIDIEVEPQPPTDQKTVAKANGQLQNLRRYNRGIVSDVQKNAFRYQFGNEPESKRAGIDADRYGAIADSAAEPQSRAAGQPSQANEKETAATNRSRAIRLHVTDGNTQAAQSPADKTEASGAVVDESRMMRRAKAQFEERLGGEANNMQVLFVVSPERPPAAAKPAE